MTIDIDTIEDKAKHQLQGPCTGMAREVLELVDELRKARAERDWLAEMVIAVHETGYCPPHGECPIVNANPDHGDCVKCWLKAASEAVEEQKL